MMKRFCSALLTLALLVSSCAAAFASSDDCVFTLTFNYEEYSNEDVAMVERALSALPLSDVSITDEKGYSRKTTVTKDGVSTVSYSYGFKNIILQCEKKGDTQYIWHIATEAFPRGEYSGPDEFSDIWVSNHPNCQLKTRIVIEYQDLYALVFLYREK